MVDITRLKAQVDCRQLVEADLGQPHGRGGKAWNWRCPFHHEQKGYSLAVWAEGWHCFGACQMSGDAINWLQRCRGMDFAAACRELGASEPANLTRRDLRPDRQPGAQALIPLSEPPSVEWQTAARRVIEDAEATLWTPEGERALAYLEQTRGLFRTTMQEARLGYIPGDYREWRKLHGLTVP